MQEGKANKSEWRVMSSSEAGHLVLGSIFIADRVLKISALDSIALA